MEVFEAVRTVLAVRNYTDTPVPPEVVRRIVEAGRLTASSMNGQPWHFLVVQNRDTLRQLGSLLRTGSYVAQAPLAIVVVTDPATYAISDASRAIQSMLLTAWRDGLGSNWVGFGGLDQVKPLLGVPAAEGAGRLDRRPHGRRAQEVLRLARRLCAARGRRIAAPR